jgi:leucyl aminopeptidase
VALGPDLPALFCNDEDLAAALLRAAASTSDPLWRLPLWRAYAADLEGKTADLNNCLIGTFAGAIYAALFLQAFVPARVRWAHIDLYGWNQKDRPGRPEGGEAQTLRAAFQFLETRYVR